MNKIKNTGFSLFELLIVLSICAIVTSLAIPSMSEVFSINRPKYALMYLDRLISYARLKAVYSGERVTLCPLVSNCCAKHYWHTELTLFIDRGELKCLNDQDTILTVSTGINPADDISYQRSGVTFKHTGSTWGLANGTFVYCITKRDGSKYGKALSLSTAGRTRLKDTSKCKL
ncbi:GspH/FimT family pseudopilin [Pseudoalteromonas luteoviolacea]|uniref:GspH/FimT family pseudopilin n=1 Tax=Pseudoalteromonas luteoviolacea TaxID=43657 RepID=UPI001EEDF35A|nr:GspH/FimT family pseudopilin [Pseudoalteromonas luteoviolacea]MCF6438270.1 GspH/FimT family pseudopilin [Pseudoalteromonas luteoviolacea]